MKAAREEVRVEMGATKVGVSMVRFLDGCGML